jgi:hypothetical protein
LVIAAAVRKPLARKWGAEFWEIIPVCAAMFKPDEGLAALGKAARCAISVQKPHLDVWSRGVSPEVMQNGDCCNAQPKRASKSGRAWCTLSGSGNNLT